MSAINEAYARIDYATILDLKNQVDALQKIIQSYTSDKFASLEGEANNVRGTRIFTETVTVGAKDSTVTVQFGSNFFALSPTITATIRDINNKLVSGTDTPVVLLTRVDNNKATFLVKRSKEASLILHIIAIGEAPD